MASSPLKSIFFEEVGGFKFASSLLAVVGGLTALAVSIRVGYRIVFSNEGTCPCCCGKGDQENENKNKKCSCCSLKTTSTFHRPPSPSPAEGSRGNLMGPKSASQEWQLPIDNRVYESTALLHQYLGFHFGSMGDQLSFDFGFNQDAEKQILDFPKRLAHVVLELVPKEWELRKMRALEIGCAVGRTSFELAREFGEVRGIDFSHSFIECANLLKAEGKTSYEIQIEGDYFKKCEAVIDPSIDRSRVFFEQGDAVHLRHDLGEFQVVIAANLICRIPDPNSFLSRCEELVAKGGFLVLTTPFTWLEQYTPKNKWIGGTLDSKNELISGKSALSHYLSHAFEFVDEKEMKFLIRETARKNQLSVAYCTIWRRK